MAPKKVVVVTDSMFEKFNVNYKETISQMFSKYVDMADVDISFASDYGLVVEGMDPGESMLKIETEGPEWVVQTPEFLDQAKDADILLVSFSAVGSKLIDAASNVKFIGAMRSGVENINIDYCTQKGVQVCNSPGRLCDPVADLTMALILGLNRQISRNDLSHKEGFDRTLLWKPPIMREMTFGIIGFGLIGKQVAKRIQGFGSKIVAYDPFVSEEEAEKLGVTLLPLNDVMAQADVVTVHARLLPATQDLVGAEQIALMKPEALFINTARAGLVDEEALVKALKEKKIRGAGLDVFRTEPLPDDHELRKLDNVLLTPHMAGGAGDGLKMTLEIILPEVGRYLKGEKLLHKINDVIN